MGYKMKGSSLYGHGKKPSVKKTDGIGEGFMNPPYRGPESKGPRAKRQGYDGYTNFTSNVTGRKVHKDGPKSTVHGVDNPGNWQPHSLRKKSPAKMKTKKLPTKPNPPSTPSIVKPEKWPSMRAVPPKKRAKHLSFGDEKHLRIAEKSPRELTKISNTPKQGTVVTRKKKKSPVKAKDERVKIDGKMYPKGYTKKDVKFLKEQREDVVRYEDLDAKGKAIWKKQGKAIPKVKKSPAKFEEVVPRKMPSRIKTRKTPKRKMPKFPHGAKIPMELKLRKTEGRGPRA
jgi:hypothetical protein